MYAVMGGANRSVSSDEDGMAGFHEIFTPELYVSLFQPSPSRPDRRGIAN
jgi:hypothetical protein